MIMEIATTEITSRTKMAISKAIPSSCFVLERLIERSMSTSNIVGYLRGSGRDLIRPQGRHDGRNSDGHENRDDDHHHEQFEHAEAAARGSPSRSGRKAMGS